MEQRPLRRRTEQSIDPRWQIQAAHNEESSSLETDLWSERKLIMLPP